MTYINGSLEELEDLERRLNDAGYTYVALLDTNVIIDGVVCPKRLGKRESIREDVKNGDSEFYRNVRDRQEIFQEKEIRNIAKAKGKQIASSEKVVWSIRDWKSNKCNLILALPDFILAETWYITRKKYAKYKKNLEYWLFEAIAKTNRSNCINLGTDFERLYHSKQSINAYLRNAPINHKIILNSPELKGSNYDQALMLCALYLLANSTLNVAIVTNNTLHFHSLRPELNNYRVSGRAINIYDSERFCQILRKKGVDLD